MEANTRKLERIFDQTITYQVPLFQRPYVWSKEANWEPLWEDIQALLDKHLRVGKAHPHFLGAVVLEQLANPTGSIESRQVIDGQQRFTTLQLFLIAARDLAATDDKSKYIERFTSLVENRRSMIDFDDEVFKVWPTNSNRAAFKAVHDARSPSALDRAITQKPSIADGSNNIVDAYKFFHAQLHDWLTGKLDDDHDQTVLSTKTLDDRYDSLWQVVKDCLQVVVIDLDKDDETQVIFETLNARGEDLLPADLIKNYLFRRAAADKQNVEKLYADHWQQFETQWWRDLVKQGRITRPRVDVFINYYLAMMTMDDVKSSHLFNAFKAFADTSKDVSGSLLVIPKTSALHIAQLARYAEVFKAFSDAGKHRRLAVFLDRLIAIDTTTVFPLLLYLHAEMVPGREAEFDQIIAMIESYLFRRMICGLTTKNYNRFFLDLLKAIDKEGKVAVSFVANYLIKSTAESSFFPDDSKLETAIKELPLYGRLAQYRVRAIFEALELHAQSALSPVLALPAGLTIEHVMPQTWQTYWPLGNADRADPVKEQKASQRRDRLLNTIGNLTLVTGSLNPSLSNSAWADKRPELLKYGKLNLMQYFHGPEADVWNEDKIEARSQHLLLLLKQIWPAIR
jgi:uncharacterized protein with ParB-like and HNH nuclease domain